MKRLLLLSLGLSLPLPAQTSSSRALVATRRTSQPLTRLLDVDLTTGKVSLLGRFSNDKFPPLALTLDDVNRDSILAVQTGALSRVLRLSLQGTRITGEKTLADVKGKISSIRIADRGAVFASVEGAAGGVFRIERNGSTPAVVASLPRISALTPQGGFYSKVAWLAESGSKTPVVNPGFRLFDLNTGRTVNGPHVFQWPTQGLTGIAELATALIRHYLTDDSGQLLLSVMLAKPSVMPLTPKLPAGGTRALRVGLQQEAIVLGGASHPYLESAGWSSFPGKWKTLAGPLPGDPVDFELVPRGGAGLIVFERSCARTPPRPPGMGSSGFPRLGNQSFELHARSGSLSAPIVLLLGISDKSFLTLPLPLPLPGGCKLHVSAEISLPTATNGSGFARMPLPVPSQSIFARRILFAQWLEPRTAGFALSEPVALHLDR
ncbi:MAG: hypothetical protein ACE5F1_16605 [Planctomycetota bacterium]